MANGRPRSPNHNPWRRTYEIAQPRIWVPVPPPNLDRQEYPLPAQGELQLFLRSFAPFKRFGGGYAGDDRGPSSDTTDTAKVRYVLTFSFEKMEVVGEPHADCSRSHGYGAFAYLMSMSAPLSATVDQDGVVTGIGVGKQTTTIEGIGRAGHGFVATAEVSAANPLVGPASDIDVQMNIRVEKSDRALRIGGNLVGDAFPSAEVFLRDAAGDAILLHHFRLWAA